MLFSQSRFTGQTKTRTSPSMNDAALPTRTDLTLSDGSSVSLHIRVSQRARSLRVLLRRDGCFELVIPNGFSPNEIGRALPAFRSWIETAKKRLDKNKEAQQLPDKIVLPLDNAEYAIRIAGDLAAGRRRLMQSTDCLMLSIETDRLRLMHFSKPRSKEETLELFGDALRGENPNDREAIALALRLWCRKMAECFLPGLLETVARENAFSYARVRVHDQKTRWGSCARIRGGLGYSINLNWRAVLLPVDLASHLCLHELCHTRHMNHSKAFHQEMLSISPAADDNERRLSAAWSSMPWWSHGKCPPLR
ncbi:MAG: M48 family metallopeptidase [Desulfovibrio sp.]|nr:M48 family metallopeptidase [Desulfovibrio sp.]